MQRVTITLDDALMEELDAVIAARGYQNRSEAIRDLARAGMREAVEEAGGRRECVAALIYTYDHAARQLAKRLTKAYHAHHEMALASMHVHLDEDTCLEVTVLRGKSGDVQHFGEHVIAERGVRHGKIVRMPLGVGGNVTKSAHRRRSAGDHRHAERRMRSAAAARRSK